MPGFLSLLIGGIATIGLVGAGAIGAIYAADTTVEATIIDLRCSANGGTAIVDVHPLDFQYEYTELDPRDCRLLTEGNFVEYKLRTEHIRIYDRAGGDCIWDSVSGIGC